MAESSEIWYSLYDHGINHGLNEFNDKQTVLYTYIDLMYSLEMGGLDGFVYNKSMAENGIDPYIKTLQYFGLKELASSFLLLSEAFKKAYDGREETWEEYIERTGSVELLRTLDRDILTVITEAHVDEWIQENQEELSESIPPL